MKENNQGYWWTHVFYLFPKQDQIGWGGGSHRSGFYGLLVLKKSGKECMLISFSQNEYSTKAEYHGPYKEKVIKKRLRCMVTCMLKNVRQITG